MSGLIPRGQAQPQTATTMGSTATSSPNRSHLDSFFDDSKWTREDVMVVAAGIQIVLWLAFLYVEVVSRG